MPDVFTKAKRSAVMSRIRSCGNKATELELAKIFRANGITGWRRYQPVFGKPDFIFPRAAAGGLCGWVLLAWVSAARDEAPDQRGVLAEEVRGEQGARPACQPDPSKVWLAGRPDLGA
ncbi:MAG: hypothetical protein ACOYNN_17775 [Terrimicrobiaceae bacterium]